MEEQKNKPIPPTCEELFECDPEQFTMVEREADASWRHGAYMADVYRRLSDDTYWSATYRRSTDGETNELREGDAIIQQVVPQQVTKLTYVVLEPNHE